MNKKFDCYKNMLYNIYNKILVFEDRKGSYHPS